MCKIVETGESRGWRQEECGRSGCSSEPFMALIVILRVFCMGLGLLVCPVPQ